MSEDQIEQLDNSITLKFERNKFNIFVYSPFMIINKTKLNLVFGQKGKTKNDEDLIRIKGFSNEFFHPSPHRAEGKSKKCDFS